MKHSIKVFDKVKDMMGKGEEWLIHAETGNVLAVFIDGNLKCEIFHLQLGNTEITKVA